MINYKWWVEIWVNTPQIDILQYLQKEVIDKGEIDCMIQQAVGEYIEKIQSQGE